LNKFPPILILAGGLGTRISSINPGRPKSMVNVNGQPFVAHQLRLLKEQGFTDAVLCVGHKSEPLREFVGDGTKFGINVVYSYDSDTMDPDSKEFGKPASEGSELIGTGGAVLKATKLVSSPFAVIYGDAWLDFSVAPVIESFSRLGKPALMTVFRNENRWAPSNLLIDGEQVTCYNKVNPTADMVHIDFGMSIFSDQAFNGFSLEQKFDLTEVVIALISRDELACFEVTERFYEVGSPQAVRDLEEHLQRKKHEPKS